MHKSTTRKVLLGGPAVLVMTTSIALLAPAASAISPVPPSISAHPNNLMVNAQTSLIGKNFPADKALRLTECSRTTWVVVSQHPCDNNNTVTLTTNAFGGFRTQFKAELCPGGVRVGPTAVACYIGVPRPNGVDTVKLEAAVKIVVTYP